MKMKECTRQEFEKVISSLEEDSYTIGNDVGRTHGITCYQRNGKVIGSSRWIKDDNVRVFTYEVAEYLYNAYITPNEALKLKYLSEYECLRKQKLEIEERIRILDGELSRLHSTV